MTVKYCNCIKCVREERIENPYGLYVGNFKVSDLYLNFDCRTEMFCRIGCSKYLKKPTCPPNIPNRKYYKEVLNKYQMACVIGKKYPFSDDYFISHWRSYSTNEIHDLLLKKEMELFREGYVYAKAFIGGSCKICSEEACNPNKCRIPHKGRVPLEATGLDVLSILNNLDELYQEPPVDFFWRIGMVFY